MGFVASDLIWTDAGETRAQSRRPFSVASSCATPGALLARSRA